MKKQSQISCCYCSLSVLLTFTRGFWLAGSYCVQISRKTHIHSSIVPAEHTVTHSWFSLVLMFSLLAEVLHLTFVSHHPVTVLLSCIKRIKMKTISGLDTSIQTICSTFVLYFVSVLSPQNDNCTFDVNQSDMTASNHIQKQFWSERACWWTL